MQKSFTFVLFGSTGDLAQRKILPALYALYQKKVFPGDIQIICFGRRPWSMEAYRAFLAPLFTADAALFLSRVEYFEGSFDSLDSFTNLKSRIQNEIVAYHLAVGPEFYGVLAENLGKGGHTGKLLIEKPFGFDGASAQSLEKKIKQYFPKENIFLIDHYLGKEGLWNMYETLRADTDEIIVSKIEGTFFETLDVASRGAFYDTVGTLRDVVQNHLFMMLATALSSRSRDPLSDSRTRVLESLSIVKESVMRAQYDGYHDANGVSEGSHTETYVQVLLVSTDPAWKETKIQLSAGKALPEKKSMITFFMQDGSTKQFDMETPKNRDAYEVVLEAALSEHRDFFVSFSELHALWRITDEINTFFPQIPLKRYKKGTFPA